MTKSQSELLEDRENSLAKSKEIVLKAFPIPLPRSSSSVVTLYPGESIEALAVDCFSRYFDDED